MPTLDWIGKKAVVNHHREVPYRLIHCDGELSAGNPDAGNLLVQGDNLEALKSLLPYYAGKVKCIYIDPPYNTGNEGWVYNDNVASPEIKAWLGKVVGKEVEDLSRHDKWLCMMYPRLRLLREFLREDGSIWINIDRTETSHLRLLCDEIFGRTNMRSLITWQKKYSVSNNAKGMASITDHILVYSKSSAFQNNLVPRTDDATERYRNPDDDPRGPWKAVDYLNQATKEKRPNLCYEITNPFTGEKIRNRIKAWKYEPDTHQIHVDENRLWWGEEGGNSVPALKLFLSEVRDGMTPHDWWAHEEVGHTDEARKEVDGLCLPISFDTPKPSRLIRRVLELATDSGDLVLDSFAGSGTTGHAALMLNKQDGGDRRFILVEMDETIAPKITAERMRRVINGYDKGGDPEKPVEPLGGGFRYCRLGTPLFNEFGDIDSGVIFADLAAHVFFSETGSPLPAKVDGASHFIGTHKDKAVYLLFSPGEQGFAREASGNVLTPDALANLPAPSNDFYGVRVVYAEGCTVSAERLKVEGVIFKQIPYQIEGN